MIEHQILNNIRKHFTLIELNKSQIIDEFKLPENTNYSIYKGNIDWSKIKNSEILNWSLLNSEEIISRMYESRLNQYEFIILQLGYDEPIYKLATTIFIDSWEEILFASNEGFPLVSPDLSIILEWLSYEGVIYCNFNI